MLVRHKFVQLGGEQDDDVLMMIVFRLVYGSTARQSAKLHGNPISYAKIACKIRVGHVGCLNLRVESTYTMVLFLYHCTHSLGRKISITFVYCR